MSIFGEFSRPFKMNKKGPNEKKGPNVTMLAVQTFFFGKQFQYDKIKQKIFVFGKCMFLMRLAGLFKKG